MTERGTGEGPEPIPVFPTGMAGKLLSFARVRTATALLRAKVSDRFVSVRAKVVSLLTLIGAALIVLSGLFAVYDFKSNLDFKVWSRAAGVGEAIVYAARNAETLGDIKPVIQAVAGAPALKGAAVAGADGRVVLSSLPSWKGKPLDIGRELEPGKAVPIPQQKRLGGYGRYPGDYALSVEFPRMNRTATVLIRVDADLLASRTVADAWQLMTWLVIAVILAILSLSLLVHRVVVAPIEALKVFAETGGEGKAEAVGPDDEIGVIARALSDSFRARTDGEARLIALAATDGLTGLGNRTHFKAQLAADVAAGERLNGSSAGGRNVGVMILNLDNFKDVNDTLGHDAGDKLLQRTAELLRGCAREGDTVARIGGDEFGVIMPGIKNADDALQLASRLVRAVGAPFRLGVQDVQQAACVGLTLYPQDGRDADVLIKNADLALSRAKLEGAGACVLYRHELHLRAIERNTIERDLRAALAKDQLTLFYQPKIDVASGRVVGAEALVRWRHEERGYVPPSLFIPVAERSGLVVPLTKWVLNEACRQNREWQDQGLTKIGLAVNVSAIDLRRTDLTDTIANTLIRNGLSPQYLELEVTESMVMQDVDVVIGTLHRLRGLGVGIGIDDFGTGYSSLAYLKRFPVKRLKIDRSFVHDVADRRDGHVIPKVIIDLAHALGMKVVAEGVETADQYERLQELGCDEVQGYFAGRPMPAAEFEVFLRNSPAGGLRGAAKAAGGTAA